MKQILLGLALVAGQAWAIVPCTTDTDCAQQNPEVKETKQESEYPTCESLSKDTDAEAMCEREDGIELEFHEFESGDE